MAVFRVEKTKDFTIMSNHHLRNTELSLKAKGLLSQMLSLPEDWDYTLAGLSQINREKIDAIREAIVAAGRFGLYHKGTRPYLQGWCGFYHYCPEGTGAAWLSHQTAPPL